MASVGYLPAGLGEPLLGRTHQRTGQWPILLPDNWQGVDNAYYRPTATPTEAVVEGLSRSQLPSSMGTRLVEPTVPVPFPEIQKPEETPVQTPVPQRAEADATKPRRAHKWASNVAFSSEPVVPRAVAAAPLPQAAVVARPLVTTLTIAQRAKRFSDATQMCLTPERCMMKPPECGRLIFERLLKFRELEQSDPPPLGYLDGRRADLGQVDWGQRKENIQKMVRLMIRSKKVPLSQTMPLRVLCTAVELFDRALAAFPGPEYSPGDRMAGVKEARREASASLLAKRQPEEARYLMPPAELNGFSPETGETGGTKGRNTRTWRYFDNTGDISYPSGTDALVIVSLVIASKWHNAGYQYTYELIEQEVAQKIPGQRHYYKRDTLIRFEMMILMAIKCKLGFYSADVFLDSYLWLVGLRDQKDRDEANGILMIAIPSGVVQSIAPSRAALGAVYLLLCKTIPRRPRLPPSFASIFDYTEGDAVLAAALVKVSYEDNAGSQPDENLASFRVTYKQATNVILPTKLQAIGVTFYGKQI